MRCGALCFSNKPELTAFLFAKGLYGNIDGIQNQGEQHYHQEKQLEIAEQINDDGVFAFEKGGDICEKFRMDKLNPISHQMLRIAEITFVTAVTISTRLLYRPSKS